MGDGFTGISIYEVEVQLEILHSDLISAHGRFVDVFNELNKILYENWYSEKAFEFNANLKEMADIKVNFATDANNLIENAVNAAKSIASSNGASFSFYFHSLKGDNTYQQLDMFKNGGTRGMVIYKVDAGYRDFKEGVIKVLNTLANTQKNISLLDDAGLLKEKFKTKLDNMIEYISEAIKNADTKMIEGIEEAKERLNDARSIANTYLSRP